MNRYRREDYTHELISLRCNKVKSDTNKLLKYVLYMKENGNLNKIDYFGLTVKEIKSLDSILSVEDKKQIKKANIYLYLSYPTELSFNEYNRLL